jgi:hypothetical protein
VPVGGSTNNSLSVVNCRHVHEKKTYLEELLKLVFCRPCIFFTAECDDWTVIMKKGASSIINIKA